VVLRASRQSAGIVQAAHCRGHLPFDIDDAPFGRDNPPRRRCDGLRIIDPAGDLIKSNHADRVAVGNGLSHLRSVFPEREAMPAKHRNAPGGRTVPDPIGDAPRHHPVSL
jgi:hypothetical protein